MTKPIASLRKKMLADPGVRAAYDTQSPEFALAHEMIAARVRAGLTQAQLARRMGTTQSVVARLESGRQLPSIKTLLRYAEATGTRPLLRLEAAE